MAIFSQQVYSSPPPFPKIGDTYIDPCTYYSYVFDGASWVTVTYPQGHCFDDIQVSNEPTKAELLEHPTLKSTWEEYMIVRKLLGLPCSDSQ